MKMACMVQDMDRTPDDYRTLCEKHGFDTIGYVKSEDTVSMEDLNTDRVQKVRI